MTLDGTQCVLKFLPMINDNPKVSRQKVYLQALVRISQIHEEIASGCFPSVKQLAEKTKVNERTIKRDLDVLRDQLNAPVISIPSPKDI
jgi:hypothetical protein